MDIPYIMENKKCSKPPEIFVNVPRLPSQEGHIQLPPGAELRRKEGANHLRSARVKKHREKQNTAVD